MLVFGSYAFPIQTLDPLRYGLPAGVQLQLYCKIGHLFWIPVFPMGRMWILKMNGEKYEPSAEIIRKIEENEVKKSAPFYAWALPLLLLIGYPTMLGMDALEDNRRQKEHVERETVKRQNLLGQIDFPEQGDLFLFSHLADGAQHYEKKNSAAVVEAVTTDSLLLRVPAINESVSNYNARKFFSNPEQGVNFTWVAKADLKKTISLEDFDYNSLTGATVPGLYSGHDINISDSKKGTTEQWQKMGHPEQPFSRFRESK